MGIDVKDLPPAYQEQALRKYMEREQRKQRPSLPRPAGGSPDKGRKYHNKPTERVTASGAVLRFDSQKEARRYDELMVMLNAGKIHDLRLQVDFTLQEAYTDSAGKRVRAIRYKADFTYLCPSLVRQNRDLCYGKTISGGEKYVWKLVVEDVKSCATRTKEYIMKRKLMKERFNIDIQEV